MDMFSFNLRFEVIILGLFEGKSSKTARNRTKRSELFQSMLFLFRDHWKQQVYKTSRLAFEL